MYQFVWLIYFISLVFFPEFHCCKKISTDESILLLNDKDAVKWLQNSKVIFIIRHAKHTKEIKTLFNGRIVENIDQFKAAINNKSKSDHFIYVNKNGADVKFFDKLYHTIVGIDGKHAMTLYPVFVGWFWSDASQKNLHDIGQRCLQQLLSLDAIRRQIEDEVHNGDLSQYWTKQISRLHVTAKFIGRKSDESIDKYLSSVAKQFYKTNSVAVTGFLLTPRTFSGHVELTADVKWMFGDAANVDVLPHVTLAVGPNVQPVQSGFDQMPIQRKIKSGEAWIKSYSIDLGSVYEWRDCNFYVKLTTPLLYDVLFSAQY